MNKALEILRRERGILMERRTILLTEFDASAPIFNRLEDEIEDIDRFLAEFEFEEA